MTRHEMATGELLPRRSGRRSRGESPQRRRPHLRARVTRSGVPGLQPRVEIGSTAHRRPRRLISNGQFVQSVAPSPFPPPPSLFLPRSPSTSCCVLAQ